MHFCQYGFGDGHLPWTAYGVRTLCIDCPGCNPDRFCGCLDKGHEINTRRSAGRSKKEKGYILKDVKAYTSDFDARLASSIPNPVSKCPGCSPSYFCQDDSHMVRGIAGNIVCKLTRDCDKCKLARNANKPMCIGDIDQGHSHGDPRNCPRCSGVRCTGEIITESGESGKVLQRCSNWLKLKASREEVMRPSSNARWDIIEDRQYRLCPLCLKRLLRVPLAIKSREDKVLSKLSDFLKKGGEMLQYAVDDRMSRFDAMRPDFKAHYSKRALVVENDEDEHSGRDVSCECAKDVSTIGGFMSAGYLEDDIIYIRFNCDRLNGASGVFKDSTDASGFVIDSGSRDGINVLLEAVCMFCDRGHSPSKGARVIHMKTPEGTPLITSMFGTIYVRYSLRRLEEIFKYKLNLMQSRCGDVCSTDDFIAYCKEV